MSVIILLCTPDKLLSQIDSDLRTQHLLSAQEIYLDGDFEGAYMLLKSLNQGEGETDSQVLYLQIMCLSELYEKSNSKARELEHSLTTYFNQNTIANSPHYEYENIVAVLLDFSVFKARDDQAFENLSSSIYGNDTLDYQKRIQEIDTYLKDNLNSYHRDSLSLSAQVFSDSLSKKLSNFEQIRFDQKCWDRTHNSGKFSLFEFGYNYYPEASEFKAISDITEIEPFLDQEESKTPHVMPVQSFELSAFNIGFNLPHKKRWKVSILYSVVTFGLQKWQLENDSILVRPHDRGDAKYLTNFNLGARAGLMSSYLITPKTELSVYYCFNPALSFFNETYSFRNDELEEEFIVPNKQNIILRHELGLRCYVSTNLYLGICYQFGEYGWLTSISSDSTKDGEEKLESKFRINLLVCV